MAKRKVKEVDFSKEGSHIAIVGSPANGQEDVTILKSKEEDLQKAEEVQITTSMSTFLTMFFYMWREDANELAELLGYEPQEWSYELIGDDTSVELLKSLDENSTVSKELYENIEKMSSEFNKLIKIKTEKDEVMAKEKEKKTDLSKEIKEAVEAALAKEKEKLADLEKSLKEEQEKNAELEKAAKAKEKDEMVELCKGYSFAEDAEKLADSLFLCKGIEGFDLILETLEKARIALKEALETEVGTDEEADLTKETGNSKDVDKTSELIKARKNENKEAK